MAEKKREKEERCQQLNYGPSLSDQQDIKAAEFADVAGDFFKNCSFLHGS